MSIIEDFENLDIFTSGEFSSVGSVVSQTAIKSQISGIFNERHEPILDAGFSLSESIGTGKRITFLVQTSDTDGLLHHDEILIKDSAYSVVGINCQGDGKLTELILKES